MALKDLMKNRNLFTRHADKGNIVVTEYISKMKVMLSDLAKFPRISFQRNKFFEIHCTYGKQDYWCSYKAKNKKVISEKKYEDP